MVILFSPVASAKPSGMSLADCYHAALKHSDEVAISDEEIHQAETQFTQALGSVLPKIALLVKEELQDPASTTSATNTFQQTFTRLSTPSVAVNMQVPIFHGFKEFQALKLSRANEAQKALLKKDVERLLMEDVAVSFFTIANIERDIQTTQKILRTSQSQLGELKKFVDLGKSRESELAQQQTSIALLDADIEQKKGDLKVAYELMSFFTGLDPQPKIQLEDPVSEKLEPKDYYVERSYARADVQAAQQGITLAQGEVKLRKGDLYPQVDLDANYYPYRVGFLKEIKWDTTISMNAPLFNWESIGLIREAKSKEKQAELRAEQTRRLAETEIKRSYDSYQSSRNQYGKYQTAATLAQKTYDLQLGDFRLGLINNLDVLVTQRTWFDALRQRDVAETSVWLDWFKLMVRSGVMP